MTRAAYWRMIWWTRWCDKPAASAIDLMLWPFAWASRTLCSNPIRARRIRPAALWTALSSPIDVMPLDDDSTLHLLVLALNAQIGIAKRAMRVNLAGMIDDLMAEAGAKCSLRSHVYDYRRSAAVCQEI